LVIKSNINSNIGKPVSSKHIKIWQTVQAIPVGKVACYGQVADLAGLPGRARLVGKALAAVPTNGWHGQTVPWYRVINAQGRISFTADSESFARQRDLLQAEQVLVLGARIKLKDFQWQPDLAELLFVLTH
jgi:methylated-DNA-protein-cysteine methyltransferase-like protein